MKRARPSGPDPGCVVLVVLVAVLVVVTATGQRQSALHVPPPPQLLAGGSQVSPTSASTRPSPQRAVQSTPPCVQHARQVRPNGAHERRAPPAIPPAASRHARRDAPLDAHSPRSRCLSVRAAPTHAFFADLQLRRHSPAGAAVAPGV